MILNVEEVSVSQMHRVEYVWRDHCRKTGWAGILGIEVQSALHVLEGTTDVSDHYVPGSKLRGGMTWLAHSFGHQMTPGLAGSEPRRSLFHCKKWNRPGDAWQLSLVTGGRD